VEPLYVITAMVFGSCREMSGRYPGSPLVSKFNLCPVFNFYSQFRISTNSQNYSNISGHGSNFETSGGRVHPPDISLQLSKTVSDIKYNRSTIRSSPFTVIIKKLPKNMVHSAFKHHA